MQIKLGLHGITKNYKIKCNIFVVVEVIPRFRVIQGQAASVLRIYWHEIIQYLYICITAIPA